MAEGQGPTTGDAYFLITAASAKRGAFPIHMEGKLEEVPQKGFEQTSEQVGQSNSNNSKESKKLKKVFKITKQKGGKNETFYYQESSEGSESYHTKNLLRDTVPKEQEIG